MKKQLIAGLTAATALVGTGVQADELAPTTTPASTTVATEEKVQPVTAQAVDTAKAKLDQASQAVAEQENVVETAEKAQEVAQADVDTAQAQVTAAEEQAAKATPEEIKSAEGKVTTAEEAVKTAEAAVTTAEKAQETAQADVDKQKSVVAEATKVVADKTEAVNQAQSDVDKAQAILDGTNSASVVKEAEDAQTALDQATENLTKADQELVVAKEADAKRAEAIKQAESQATTAQADLTAKTTVLAQATQAAEQMTKALEKAEEDYAKAQADYQSINTITLTFDYIQALKDYAKNYSETSQDNLRGLADSLRRQNIFKVNLNDDQTKYPINDIPREVLTEASLFASDLINQIRRQVGSPILTVVTPSSVAFVDEVTDEAVAMKFDTWNEPGHNDIGITNVARKYHLAGSEAVGNSYENWFGDSSWARREVNLSQIKAYVYDSLLSFMFSKREWLHASSIAGLTYGPKASEEYIGIDLSNVGGYPGMHFIGILDTDLTPKSTNFNTTAIPNPRTTEALTQAHDQAQAILTSAQSQNNQAQENLRQAQSAQDQAKTKLESALVDLDKAQAVAVQTETAQTKRDQTDTAKVQAQSRHDKAQRALSSLSADVKTKQDNLAKAKEVLKTKQVDQAQAQGVLDNETGKLKTLETELVTKTADVTKVKQALSNRQADLKKAQDYLTSLLNAPAHLTKAEENLKLTTDKLNGQLVAVKEAKAWLIELKGKESELAKAYDTFFERYQAQLAVERVTKLKAEHDAIKRQGGQPLPVLDASGQIIGYTVAKETPKPTSSASRPVAAPASSSGAKKTLPATGSQSSVLLSLVGSIMATFGVTDFRRKKD